MQSPRQHRSGAHRARRPCPATVNVAGRDSAAGRRPADDGARSTSIPAPDRIVRLHVHESAGLISRASSRRAVRRWLYSGLGIAVLLIWLLNHWVINNTEAYVYTSWALLPDNDVGLVLGTSPYTRDGQPNPQFAGRVEAAAQLYQLGKIRHIIVSGANPDASYNEPRTMWQALVKRGVPPDVITMDFAGFRTFDSVARAQAVFGLNRLTLITQRYHAFRAVFIAKKLHMSPVAFCAPGGGDIGPLSRTAIREVFARIKAVLDIYLLDTVPKFLGPPHQIDLAPPPGVDTSAPAAAASGF
ncbi:MAG: YdcF family protein [Gammaproteobacteria bacterium]|nr:YdcF family protein [Gammaproteobacteria bacterium]